MRGDDIRAGAKQEARENGCCCRARWPKVSTTSCRQLTTMLLHTAVQQAMQTKVVTKVDRRDRYCLASFETPRPARGELVATLTKMWASCAISGSIWSVGTQWMLSIGSRAKTACAHVHHFSLAVPLPWRVERGLCRAPSAELRENLPSNHAYRDDQRR
jgi:hypothetical protein